MIRSHRAVTLSLTMALAVAASLAGPTPLRAEPGNGPKWVTTNLMLPVAGFSTVNTESVYFIGLAHVVVHAIPSEPIIPPNPVRFHTNLVGVVGVGQSTGALYRAVGAANFQFADSIQLNDDGTVAAAGVSVPTNWD